MASTVAAYVEIFDVDTSTVVATSPAFDPATATTDFVAAWTAELTTDLDLTHSYQYRIRFHVVKTGVDVESAFIDLVEPQFGFSAIEVPDPYRPGVGKWVPGELHITRMGDSFYRFEIDTVGTMRWGPGTSGPDVAVNRTGTRQLTWDDDASGLNPIQERHEGAIFERGPTLMDLVIAYASPGIPSQVDRLDEGAPISTTVITYAGPQVASVVTTRFGRTFTVIPVYTGTDITSLQRVVS